LVGYFHILPPLAYNRRQGWQNLTKIVEENKKGAPILGGRASSIKNIPLKKGIVKHKKPHQTIPLPISGHI
jgi:hypothetical protein